MSAVCRKFALAEPVLMLLPLEVVLFSSRAMPDALHCGPAPPSLHPRDAFLPRKDKAHLPGFDTATNLVPGA